jgi:hypothetical protein
VDAVISRRVFGRVAPPRSRMYGLGAWIPILMLGLAYAAAAFAKIDEIGLRWITGGAVRYVFLVDGHSAPVPWNKYIIRSDALSVLFSALAVGGEAFVILAAIWPTTAIVCAAGAMTLGLQLGFYVLQGVWWSAWWALLPAFLPWEAMASTLGRSRREAVAPEAYTRSRRLSLVAGAVLLVAVLQQPVASLLRVTYGFALSDFPMYSNVYFASREEVVEQQERVFQPPLMVRFAGPEGAADVDGRVSALDQAGRLADVARKVARGEALTDADAASVREFTARYVARFGTTAPDINVLGDTWRFDWSSADFVPRRQWKPIATVSLERGIIEARKP